MACLSSQSTNTGKWAQKSIKELKFSPEEEVSKLRGYNVIDPTTGAPATSGEVDFLILTGKVSVLYTENLGSTTLSKKAVLSDGLKLKAVFHNDDEYDAIRRKGDDYIRENANHFLEEVYEKIPEARNADEIIY